MKSYFIFAIILTAIYVVYYAANIARDLFRRRSQGRTDEEVFELDPDDGQDSVAVTESETGFNVGTEKYETAFDIDLERGYDGQHGGDRITDVKDLQHHLHHEVVHGGKCVRSP